MKCFILKTWAAADVKAAMAAEVSKIVSGDSVYATLLAAPTTSSNHYNDVVSVNVNMTKTVQEGLIDGDVISTDEAKDVAAIKAYGTSSIAAIDSAYAAALSLYKSTDVGGIKPATTAYPTDASEKINTVGTTSELLLGHTAAINTLITNVSAAYNSSSNKVGARTLTAYKAFVDGLSDKVDLVKDLDAAYAAWLVTKAPDTGYITATTAATTDKFYVDDIHALYVLGDTRATMTTTKRRKTARLSKSHKGSLSSDRSLQLDFVKLELLVIADQTC